MSSNKVSYTFHTTNCTSNWHLCSLLERWSENSILRERPADCRTSSAALWLEKLGSWLPRCQRWNFRHGKPLQNALWRQGSWRAWEPRETEQNLRWDLWRTQTARRPQIPPLWQVSNHSVNEFKSCLLYCAFWRMHKLETNFSLEVWHLTVDMFVFKGPRQT